ncbi:hypothetical protein [Pelagerythrobacter sp.]|uniref:hypothetical protein n=1 Tax=Pelagerythrobacter sp. TaxID=2800702 RepID=UPI0035B22D6D
MALVTIAAVVLMAQGATAPDVAYRDLLAQKNGAAIERIETNDRLESDDPARLINLGIAHAREGHEEEARAMFRAVARSESTVRLELAGGEWVDSGDLARRALRLLDSGAFAPAGRMTMR